MPIPMPTPSQVTAPGVEPPQAHDPRHVGPYQVLGVLGAGGMGTVYLAARPGHGELVAVKVVHPGLAPDEQFRARFAREVAAGRHVRGPWTAAVVDADPDAPTPWLATEYVPGVALNRAVATAGPLPPPVVAALAAHLARALVAIHTAGLVHRDVKPGNVLLATDRPRMIDFGISRALDATRMTSTGLAVGTPAFMSPEQADGAGIGTASDVFSLGAVLVWAATGTGPFGEGTPVTLLRRILTAEPGLGALTGPVRERVAECRRRDPASRPTAAQLADRLPPAPVGTGWLPPAVAALLPDPARIPAPLPGPLPRTVVPPPPALPPQSVSRRGLLLGMGAVLGTAAVAGFGPSAAGLFGGGSGDPPPGGGTGRAAPRWSYPTGGPVNGLAAGDGVVYAAGADAVAHAIEAGTGRARWTNTLPRAVDRTPVVADGSVYVDAGHSLFALATDGAPRWEADGRLVAAGDGIVVAGTTDDRVRDQVTAYDAATGAQRWHSPVDGALTSGFALDTPGAVAGGRAHVGLEGALRTLDVATGATLWEQPLPDLKTVTTAGPLVVCTGGVATGADTLVAFDAVTGQERWRRTTEQQYGPVAAHDGTLYVDAGHGAGLTAMDAETGDTRWELDADGLPDAMIGTAPVVVGDTCYVAGTRIGGLDATPSFALFAHAVDTGEERWSLDLALDTGYTAPIAVVGSTVVLGSARFDAASGTVVGIS